MAMHLFAVDLSRDSATRGKHHFFQPKLTINQPNDIYEQEADAMADKVMRMTDHENMGQPFFRPRVSFLQRMCADCEEEENSIQRKEINKEEIPKNNEFDNYVSQLNSGGQPLSNEVQNFYESRFGHDFSQVKVHTDTVAAKSAQSINALAYTSGNHIVFNQGQYSPDSASGKRLLGHELTHVVQQDQSQALRRKDYLQRLPFGDRDPIHDPLLDQYSRERGIPREEASHHSPDYEQWLNSRTEAVVAFDNHQLLPEHLSDQSVQNRFSTMTLEDLYDYREEYVVNGAKDPIVIIHIGNLMRGRPLKPCSQADIQKTDRMAQRVLSGLSTIVNQASASLTRLQSAWSANKADLLAGRSRLDGVIPCAFKSNFNIDETNSDFGVTMIRIESRLRQFQRRLTRPVSFSCEGINNHFCLGGTGLDADGYVINHQDPIHLCIGFRNSIDLIHQRAVIIHEFLHLLPGVDDSGGYAGGGFGAQTQSCQLHTKFPASITANILDNTADAITGFILHIDNTSPTLRVI